MIFFVAVAGLQFPTTLPAQNVAVQTVAANPVESRGWFLRPKGPQQHGIMPSFEQYLPNASRIFTTPSNLYYLAAGAGLAGLLRPFDDDIVEDVAQENNHEAVFGTLNAMGNFFFVGGASVATYLIGRASSRNELSNTGLYLTQAFLTQQLLTFIIKEAVDRRRPNGKNLSFPSGHAANAFTVASVLAVRHGPKIGIPAYVVASLIGVARVRTNKHFPSDVVAGATLGIIVGRSFVAPEDRRNSLAVAPFVDFGHVGLNMHYSF